MSGRRRWAMAALITAFAAGCGEGVLPGAEPAPAPNPGVQSPEPAGSPSPSASPTTPPPTAPPPTSSPPTTPSTNPPTTPSNPALRMGDRGPRVLALQRQLADLGYWLGTPDGVFDDVTRHAVVALQKAAGLARDGVVGPNTAAALRQGYRPVPRTRAGDALEVDLRHQILMVVDDGSLTAILDTSTGGGYTYWQSGGAYFAVTPRGQFTVTRRVDGWDRSRLGWLWRPAYFFGGYAIHGYAEVPPYPASHGCVRVTMAAMDWLWATGRTAPGLPVLIY